MCSARSWSDILKFTWLQGVANRDLKLENLLLDRDGSDGTRPLLKICDFGYSKVPRRPDVLRTVETCSRCR
jgi:serine/threonine protein kinase